MGSPRSLAALIGENCKRMRERVGATREELARCARQVGLHWDVGKVRRFESGGVSPSFATVLAVTLALQKVTDEHLEDLAKAGPIDWAYRGVADLLESEADDYVKVTDKLMVRPEILRRVCEGFAWNTPAMTHDAFETVNAAVDALAGVIVRQGLTEHRLAKRLGIKPAHLADLTLTLWGGTFSEERDRRLGPDAKQQNRSQMTRKMQAELEEVLADGNH